MTPEIWFEYVFYTVAGIGLAGIAVVVIGALIGIDFGKGDE